MEVGSQSLSLISLKEWLEFYPSAGLFSVFKTFLTSRHAILASICGTQLEKDLGKISASAEPSPQPGDKVSLLCRLLDIPEDIFGAIRKLNSRYGCHWPARCVEEKHKKVLT